MTNPFAPPTEDVSDHGQPPSDGQSVDGSTPNVLEYFPERPRHHPSGTPWYILISPLVVASVMLFVEPRWTIPSGGVTLLALWYYLRRRRKRPEATLTIRNSNLVVFDAEGLELLGVTLLELEEVALDTKTIQRVEESVSTGGVVERRFDGRLGGNIDNSRIEFVTTKGTTPLTEYYTSSIDANEWFSKIRRFLRKGGWTPLDERAE